MAEEERLSEYEGKLAGPYRTHDKKNKESGLKRGRSYEGWKSVLGEKEANLPGTRADERSVTEAEVERLIEEAEREAKKAQGSTLEPSPECSQQAKNSSFEEGSPPADELASQEFHQVARKLIEDFMAELKEGCTVGSLGGLVWDALKKIDASSCCRPRSITGSKELFPLPVGGHLTPGLPHGAFLQAMICGLNSLGGAGYKQTVERPSPAASKVLKRLERVVAESAVLEAKFTGITFESFFGTRGLDYSGEEVKLAQKVRWRNIEPSLPPQVGQLDIRDFLEDGVLHFVTHIDETLVPEVDQCLGRTPSVMVDPDQWEELAVNLVKRGLCKVVPQSQLYHVGSSPLLNGLFSVGKDEVKDGIAVGRLIMNLKPWNAISQTLSGDIGTLPLITNMGALYLHDNEVILTSSEDLRCFFYLFKVPPEWEKFMGFGRAVPRCLVPPNAEETNWYLTGQVLPMGYLNSVGIAQHIHRCVIKRAIGSLRGLGCTVQELRRDRTFTCFPNLFRIYLDNFDQLQRVDKGLATMLAGTPSDLVTQVREYYDSQGLPRHPKKSVEQALQAEVQGAWLDGRRGTLCAKPSKVVKYIELALETLRRGKASQRELQIIGGGFVYAAMFRRPLLASLNQIWRSIQEREELSAFRRCWLSRELMVELFRFIALIPLAFNNFRTPFDSEVTASDASTSGGGICVSRGLTPYGHAASLSQVRGEAPEELDLSEVLCVGLFDGIGALRVALDALGVPVCGHISVEQNVQAQRVVEANFPDCILVNDVNEVDMIKVKSWALKFTGAALVLVGAGPPCQGVSGLNCDRKGALRDCRSKLFQHVPRIVDLFKVCFPWAQVHSLTENVASMDSEDCDTMNKEFELLPWFIDAHLMSLAHRPRLYWISWELREGEGVEIYLGSEGKLPLQGQVDLVASVDEKAFLEPGCKKPDQKPFPTFTTARPSPCPMRKPAGLKDCLEHEILRWKDYHHKFPPYQFKDCHCVREAHGRLRPPSVLEREVILGFPTGYTVQCMTKATHGTQNHEDCRLSLLGNSWSVGVVTWLLSQLLGPLGIAPVLSPQEVADMLTPGKGQKLQGLLLRPPLGQGNRTYSPSEKLVAKLCGLVSLKGEDLLLQSNTEVPVRYHRLRSSLPGRLW